MRKYERWINKYLPIWLFREEPPSFAVEYCKKTLCSSKEFDHFLEVKRIYVQE